MDATARMFVVLGAVNGFFAVAAGAFGAHALKARLSAEALVTFETGARYHMFHAIGLLAVALVASARPSGVASASGWAMLAGIVLFCGSLYALALSGVNKLGLITPLGGLAFLAGWALLAAAALTAPASR